MELETLFTDQRWSILQHLSNQKCSPSQLSKLTNTTPANISQQLRLLEMASLVKKEKVSTRDKGKPRTLFSLSNEFSYVIMLINNRTDKKLLKLSQHNKAILKIWMNDNEKVSYLMEKLYWKLEPYFESIKFLGISAVKDHPEVLIAADEKDIEKKINFKEFEGLKITFLIEKNIGKYNVIPIFDPKNLSSKKA